MTANDSEKNSLQRFHVDFEYQEETTIFQTLAARIKEARRQRTLKKKAKELKKIQEGTA